MRKRAVAASSLRIAAPVAVLGFAALVSVILATARLEERSALFLTDCAAIFVSAFASLQCWSAARAAEGRVRTGWMLFFAGTVCWTVGEITWSVYELVLDVGVPFPSLADLAYLVGYPVLLAGILLLSMPPRGTARIRTLLDASLVAVLATGPLWLYVASPTATESGASVLEAAIGLGYPAGDVLLLFGMALAAMRSWRDRSGLVFGLLSVGWGLILVADFAFALADQAGTFEDGSVINAGWLMGYAFIALGAATQVRLQPSHKAQGDAQTSSVWPTGASAVSARACGRLVHCG